MNVKQAILVTGGAGFIGANVSKLLSKKGYDTIIVDNLSTSDARTVIDSELIIGDIGDRTLLQNLFSSRKIKAVMHFAASLDVGQSIEDPAQYYQNNVCNTLVLLDEMRKAGIDLFIFSSSAAVYGIPNGGTVTEETPCHPINPYGHTKLIVEEALKNYAMAYNLQSISLRYFNAAGGDPDGEIKSYRSDKHNLIPALLMSVINPDEQLRIFGTDYPTQDGTCIRDYIHVRDLAEAHLMALDALIKGHGTDCFNLGGGSGYSVLDVIRAAEEALNTRIDAKRAERRPGDPASLIASSEKARKDLGWSPALPDLHSMIRDAWCAMEPIRKGVKR